MITDVEIEDESSHVQVLSAEALSGQSLLATLPRIVGYRTCAIESLAPGQWIVSRDGDAPEGPCGGKVRR